MERIAVDSSNVVSVGYDEGTLEVEFNSGIYCYYDVPEHIFDELMASDSKGSYLHRNVKSSYSYERV
ncbi:MAG: KTSC domain-containing protein [Colwellia sp.]|jgi:hypothetical protein